MLFSVGKFINETFLDFMSILVAVRALRNCGHCYMPTIVGNTIAIFAGVFFPSCFVGRLRWHLGNISKFVVRICCMSPNTIEEDSLIDIIIHTIPPENVRPDRVKFGESMAEPSAIVIGLRNKDSTWNCLVCPC